MNLATLAELVGQGESERLELKASTGQLREAMRTLSAMCNGHGGHILFGVRDDGAIIGQIVSARTREDIANELRRIVPSVDVDIEQVPLDNGQQVIVLSVPGGDGRRPYAYDGRCYRRIGPTTSVMSEYHHEQMIAERMHGTLRWESALAPDWITLDDLDLEELQRTVERALELQRLTFVPSRRPEDLLRGLNLLIGDRLTHAAVALYGNSHTLSAFYPQLEVRLARFRGTSKLAPFADNRAYWGHAFEQQRRAEMFLADHVPIAGYVHPDRAVREDRPLYAYRATREAIANAICHRDYTMAGGAITVAMYDDHLDIGSPGGLRFGLTPEKLLGPHESRPWNPTIANVFYLNGIIERWGTGTNNIIDWCREIHAPAPTWEDQENSVIVSFAPAPAINEEVTRHEPVADPRLTARQRILIMLRDNGELSKAQMAERLGQSRVSGQVNNIIRELLKSGDIQYTVPKRPRSPAQRYRLSEQGRAMVEQMTSTQLKP